MKRVLAGLLLALTVVASGVVFLMARDRGRLLRETAQSTLSQKGLEAENLRLRAEVARLSQDLKDTKEKSAAAVVASLKGGTPSKVGASEPAKESQSPKSAPGRQGMKVWAEMLKSPEMKEMMKQQQLAMMESQYGGLFARFKFDEGEKADFKKLLSDRLTEESDFGLKLMEEGITPEQRSALLKQHEAAKKVSDGNIRTFLNSDADHATFTAWEATKGERMQLEMGRGHFTNSGSPLTTEQEDQLINLMHQQNLKPSEVPDMGKPENFDPGKFTPADIEKQLARQDQNAQAVFEASAQFLSPAGVPARHANAVALTGRDWAAHELSDAQRRSFSAETRSIAPSGALD